MKQVRGDTAIEYNRISALQAHKLTTARAKKKEAAGRVTWRTLTDKSIPTFKQIPPAVVAACRESSSACYWYRPLDARTKKSRSRRATPPRSSPARSRRGRAGRHRGSGTAARERESVPHNATSRKRQQKCYLQLCFKEESKQHPEQAQA